ncbi:MAG TPA: type 1 glutamine amidotransferase domain-containing protein [Planctomycetota bacterium]|nr:type 1 glutamine amidotransferase domain-containing protein [Planctomycetota bacterium]
MKQVAILVEDLYQEMEVWYPAYRLREEGIKTVFVGTGKPEYKSKMGYPVAAEADARDVSASQFDAIVIPGGYAPDILRRHESVNRLVAEMFKAGKVVSSICHGLWVCVSAGILKGRTATCFFAVKDDVINAGATYVDREVVVDGNLITARKPDDLPAFMRETLKALGQPSAIGHQRAAKSLKVKAGR